MNTKIKVSKVVTKNGWYNIVTSEGKDVSIFSEKNPKLKEQLELHANDIVDFELECNLIESKGKLYAWDVQEQKSFNGGFQKKQGSDESFSLSYAKDVWVAKINSGDAKFDVSECLKVASAFYKWMKERKG